MSFFYQDRKERFFLFCSENNTYASHLHRQAECIVVLSGSLQVTASNQTLEMKQGDYTIIFPNQVHSLYTPERSRILLIIFDAGFCPAFEQDFYTYEPLFFAFSTSTLSIHGHTALEQLQRLWLPSSEESHLGNSSEISYPASRKMLLTESYLQLFLADIFPTLSLSAHKDGVSTDLGRNILLHIETNYMEHLSLDSLSEKFKVSRFTISRLFSEKFHTSFPDYLNGWRLAHARRLLLTSSLPVTEIAYDAGFSSLRTFFRLFQQTYGMSPKQYRDSQE